ncbi:uncharacterized protein UHO2_00539 [Ustilago hordei]|uniref:uncharacterized protein n=1 Tax=Ustilago hordei TaxID=120017 RepID=UPI001A46D986|nr:uncharacterized protein UHO2_00539 [Ustilago hordei]SYW82054.1 related to Gag-pol polyprotein [Ustilago hordei]
MAGVLRHFNYHLPMRLETDASDFAIVGVLKQEHEKCWHPVAFYSRKMLLAEKNYENHDKELLAVVACLTQWRHMLAGLPSQLAILTDHEALKYFKWQCHITGQQASEEQEHNVQQLLPTQVFKGVENEISKRSGIQQNPAENVVAGAILQISAESVPTACSGNNSALVAPMLTMESIAMQELKELTKIFQPLDTKLQEIHVKKPFEIKDSLWHSGRRLVIPKVTMPGRTNNHHLQSAKEVDGQSLSIEHL